jgi:hypothetical protein
MRELCRFAWIRELATTPLSLDVSGDGYMYGGREAKTVTRQICNYNNGRVRWIRQRKWLRAKG